MSEGFFIEGWGSALPMRFLDQQEAAAWAARLHAGGASNAAAFSRLYRQSGVQRRGSALMDHEPSGLKNFYPANADETCLANGGPTTRARMERYTELMPELAVRAAAAALADASRLPIEVTHLITVSCTGFGAPGFDIELIHRLGLSPSIARTHVGFMGCHGALNGLRVAAAFTGATPNACVLLCAAELCSLHFQHAAADGQAVANALFSDGAAALVGSGHGSAPSSNLPESRWQISASASTVFKDSAHAMSWSIGDHGFEMKLSPDVPNLIEHNVRPWLEAWLGSLGLSLEDIATWAVHPGGSRILNATARALALPSEALAISREVLAECGNMSSPTILFILERLARTAAPRPCVALAFGPGLAAEAVLIL